MSYAIIYLFPYFALKNVYTLLHTESMPATGVDISETKITEVHYIIHGKT